MTRLAVPPLSILCGAGRGGSGRGGDRRRTFTPLGVFRRRELHRARDAVVLITRWAALALIRLPVGMISSELSLRHQIVLQIIFFFYSYSVLEERGLDKALLLVSPLPARQHTSSIVLCRNSK